MKRIIFTLAAAIMLSGAVWAQSDSLGDYARGVRKEKRPPAKKTYTNENLPNGGQLSVVGPSGSATTTDDKDADKAPSKDKKDAKPADKKDGAEALRGRIADQHQKIADISHELDLLQREYKLRIAAFYGDAGTQLRDSKRWTEEDAKYRADIADKQKQLDDAKAKLDDLQEQARQAGVRNTE